ncbi:ketopantoate reductase family protein [Gluconobacter sp. Dm-44]|uniref:ketopantoate reductase family protein n=1 Tax=Gluconobacter sp. Dm-44 TaxID=2799805 RepID=UPI001B8D18F6|nr:2-dehydropantoate 2-reductase [Gluconobacter sp. Dm-44]MBS1060408.1 2-dehydropantoate 2-reductase [Gluconobacter sp. Dm-44]
MTSSRYSATLIGAGSVGLVLAASLAKADWDVSIVGARTPLNKISMQENGISSQYSVKRVDVNQDFKPPRVLIIAVKSQQVETISHWLPAFDSQNTTVLVAQNGIDQRQTFRKYFSNSPIIPAIIYFNAQRDKPGSVNLRRIGHQDVCLPQQDLTRLLASAFSTGGLRVLLTEDIQTRLWLKLLANISVNPLTALTGQPTRIMHRSDIADSARALMLEALPVAQAEGAKITIQDLEDTLKWISTIPPESRSSMLQDKQAMVPLEYQALTGAVVRAGARHSIPTPLNELVLSLLAGSEIEPPRDWRRPIHLRRGSDE